MELPQTFCWTRFGTEAGQPIGAIFERKEAERRANGGLFLWGIGNNVSPSLPALLKDEPHPMVLFSPIKSKPQAHDVRPSSIAVWTRAVGADGQRFELPEASMVTSRYSPSKNRHYALVCRSHVPLDPLVGPNRLSMGALRNAKTGNPLGSSQVTAIVRRDFAQGDEAEYPVSFACELVAPFVVVLEQPIVVEGDENSTEQAWKARAKNPASDYPVQLNLAV